MNEISRRGALVLGLGGALSLAAPIAPASGALTVQRKFDRHEFRFKGGEIIQCTVWYRYGFYSNPEKYGWVQPYLTLVSYNLPGGTIDCNEFSRKYDGVRFNWYFWQPYRGINFNPPGENIGCDTSSMNSGSQWYSARTTPRLKYGPGNGNDRQPRWKCNVTLRFNVRNDKDKSYAQDFNPFG